jgi:hypothetical protein
MSISAESTWSAGSYPSKINFVNAGNYALRIGSDRKLVIGTTGNTNLYESAANILKTDDSLYIATALGVGTSSTPTTAGVIRCDTGLGVGIDPDGNWIVNIEKDQNAHTSLSVANANNHASAYGRITVWGATNYLSLISTPALGTYLGTAGLSGIACVNTAGFQLRNVSNTDMTFKTNDTVRMTIAAAGSIDVVGALMANSLGWDNVQTVDTSAASPISVTPTSSRIEVPGKGSGMDFTIALQAGALVEGTILAVSFIGAAYDLTIDSDGADVVLDAKEGCLFIKSSIGWLPLGGAS